MIDVKFLTAIGIALLITILVLMSCVTGLLCKLTNIMKAPKEPVCLVLRDNRPMVARDKITAAPSLAAEYYSGLRCCEECHLYTDSGPLAPCFCDINEGL